MQLSYVSKEIFMLQSSLQAIVLAAGKSSRFSTTKTKLSYMLCGQELLAFPLQLLKQLSIPTTVILGYQKELLIPLVETYYPGATWVEQQEQRGTGHAVRCTEKQWNADHILVLNGDVPLLRKQDLTALVDQHIKTGATISCIAAYNMDPSLKGYGRFVTKGKEVAIVEERDFTGDRSDYCRVNAGIYLFKRAFLEKTVPQLIPHPTHKELYITDLIQKASMHGEHIELVDAPFDYVRGVNTLQELWVAEHIKKSDMITTFLAQGVRFTAPQSVSLDVGVTIEPDSIIGYGVHLTGKTTIGSNVTIDAFSIVENATVKDNVHIRSHSVISSSILHAGSQVGPFAHIHKQSSIHEEAVIGNFVEISKSSVGPHTKAKHLAYIGTARVGSSVTIGAGAITCNYNGVTKNITTIERNSFIGSNVALIAPVIIKEGAIVAAGSTITKDVPADALAIERSPQIIKESYASLLKERYKQTISSLQEEKLS